MTVKSPFKRLTGVQDLPASIPQVPVFDGEKSFDAVKEGQAFLERLAAIVEEKDWDGFAGLFADSCFWKDSLTLTFDKRTLHGKEVIAEAWKTTSETRKPVIHTTPQDYGLKLPIAFNRLAPTLATLDVPFCFSTDMPKSNCVGLAKLTPQPDGTWKIWVMSTHFVSLQDHPFKPLPRKSPSLVSDAQRGKSRAQGLPKLPSGAVFDALVIGASTLGVANTIRLESLDANVIAFDSVDRAAGNWSGPGKAFATLHHRGSIITLPQYPMNAERSASMGGAAITEYISEAVEALKLPVFCGVKVVSNTYDETSQLWEVLIEDVGTGEQATVTTKNLILCVGAIANAANARYPKLADRQLFRGPVQHSSEYVDATGFEGKKVVVVGASNSAHDIARSLAEGGASDVTLLQRGPTAFFEWERVQPVLEGPYNTVASLETADFLFYMMPVGISRLMAQAGLGAVEAAQSEFYARLEAKGYSIERNRDFVKKMIEARNGSFFMDREKTLDLVFDGRINVARGEAVRYADEGIIVRREGAERQIDADAIVLATGFEDVDVPQRWVDSGFLKSKLASSLENPCTMEIDQEGEYIGFFTESGRKLFRIRVSPLRARVRQARLTRPGPPDPHLYIATLNLVSNRWMVSSSLQTCPQKIQ